MAYTLGNKCAKNCCKRTNLVQLIVVNVVTCFLPLVSILTRDIDIANLSVCLYVCLSVCPSVTFRYQMKTA